MSPEAQPVTYVPIGVIRTPHTQAKGTPIQPRFAEGIEGTVEVFDAYVDGLTDLNGFERIWLIYHFDRAGDAHVYPGTPQPRDLVGER